MTSFIIWKVHSTLPARLSQTDLVASRPLQPLFSCCGLSLTAAEGASPQMLAVTQILRVTIKIVQSSVQIGTSKICRQPRNKDNIRDGKTQLMKRTP